MLLIWGTVDSWWLEMDVLSSNPPYNSMVSILHINWRVAIPVIYLALVRSVNANALVYANYDLYFCAFFMLLYEL